MFEGALVESRGQLGSPLVRWTAVGSLVVQGALAGVLVAIPALRPDRLQMLTRAHELAVPLVPKPIPTVRMKVAESSASAAIRVPSLPMAQVESGSGAIRTMMPGPLRTDDPAPAGPGMGLGMGVEGHIDGLWDAAPAEANVVRAVRPSGPVRVSSGVSAGMLVSEIRPVYPAIARAARIEGTVVVHAVIAKDGRIESAEAESGPEMLRKAAVEAVAAARYRPYQLNGQAVEVETTVTVSFRLGS